MMHGGKGHNSARIEEQSIKNGNSHLGQHLTWVNIQFRLDNRATDQIPDPLWLLHHQMTSLVGS